MSHPQHSDESTPVLVFVHGTGGSFIWYHHWLRNHFPRHVIISPAYGTNTGFIASTYLAESQEAAARILGHRLAKPVLVGLSGGGFGALRAYSTTPAAYRRVIVLAAYFPPDLMISKGRNLDFRFLAGGAEHYVVNGSWDRSFATLRRARANVSAQTIPDAGHFFILTHEEQTTAWLEMQLRDL